MRRVTALLLLLCLSACVNVPQAQPALPRLQLAPSAFGSNVSLAQRLTLEKVSDQARLPRGGMPRSLDAQLEIDTETVQLAGFALGQRILTLSWNGNALTSQRHPLLPAEVEAETILRDVQLVYWPATSLNAALPAGWRVVDAARQRSLQFEGRPLLTITYQAEPRWAGRAELDNLLEGYRLTIDSTPQTGQ